MGKFDLGGKVTYGIDFKVDKTQLQTLQAELQKLYGMSNEAFQRQSGKIIDPKELAKTTLEIKSQVVELQGVLDRSFNTDLGTFNLKQLNQELSKIDLSKLQNDFMKAGATGTNALRSINAGILTQNRSLKQSSELLDKMVTTFQNTVRFGISSSIYNNLVNSLQKAFDYTVKLDKNLTDIRIVSNKSAADMENFAISANKAAQALGKSTRDYTEASLIYYQQGLTEEDVAARTAITLKAANVTGQRAEDVSEQLTAVWNGYKVGVEEAELYVDKLAAVAATTAADLEELSVGMSKVASAANLMGVDVDQLSAQLATIVSITKQAPESVGVALKTIYARMSDISAGLDDEVSLSGYTTEMANLGINVLDSNNKLRDMGDVIEEIGGKWTSMSREQQVALSQTMAGTRQYNNLLSLFDNWGDYEKALETSANAAGTLNKQQSIYLESTEAHLQRVKTATEGFYKAFADKKSVTSVADAFTHIINTLTNFTQAIGGGVGAIQLLGATFMRVASTQIGRGLVSIKQNIKGGIDDAQNEVFLKSITDQLGGKDPNAEVQGWMDAYAQYSGLLNKEQRAAYGEVVRTNVEMQNQLDTLKEQERIYTEVFNRLAAARGDSLLLEEDPVAGLPGGISAVTKDSSGTHLDTLSRVTKEYDEALNKIKEIEDTLGWDSKNLADENLKIIKEESLVLSDALAKLAPVAGAAEKEVLELEQRFESFSKLSLEDLKTNYIKDIQTATHRSKILFEQSKKEAKTAESLIDRRAKGISQTQEEDLKDRDAHLEELNKNLSTVNKTKEIVALAGSFLQLGSAMSMVFNIGRIWDNESLTGAEKLLQTVMALGTAFGTVYSAWAGVGKALNTLGNVAVATKERDTAANIKNALSEAGVAASKKVTSAAVQKLTQNQIAETGSQMIGGATKAPTSLIKGTGVTAGLSKIMGSAAAATAAITAVGVALAAVAAAWGALALKEHLVGEGLKKRAALSQSTANRVLEEAEATRKGADNLKEMVEQTKQLEQQQKDGALSINEYRDSLYKLAVGYKEAALAAKLLTTSEEDLEGVVIDASIQKNKEAIGKENEAKWASQRALSDQLKNAASNDRYAMGAASRYKGGNSIEVAGVTWQRDSEDADLQRQLEMLAIREGVGERLYLDDKHINADALAKLLASNQKEVKKILEKFGTKVPAKQLLKYLESENVDKGLSALQETLDKTQDLQLENLELGAKKTHEEIKTLEDYRTQVGQLAEKAFKKGLFSSKEDAKSWARSVYTGFSEEMLDFSQRDTLELSVKSWMKNFYDILQTEAANQLPLRLKIQFFTQKEEVQNALKDLTDNQLSSIMGQNQNQTIFQLSDLTEKGHSFAEAIKIIGQSYDETAALQMRLGEGIKSQLKDLNVGEESFKRYAEGLRESIENLEGNGEAAQRLALRNLQINKGMEDLSANMGEWQKTLELGTKALQKGEEAGIDYYNTIADLGNALEKVFGFKLSGDFITDPKNLEIVQDLLKGNVSQLEELQKLAVKDYIANLRIVGNSAEVEPLRANLQKFLDDYDGTQIEIGTSIGEVAGLDEYVKTLNKMLEDGQVTQQQVTEALAGINYNPSFKEEKITRTTEHVFEVFGVKVPVKDTYTMTVPQINAEKTTRTKPPSISSWSSNQKKKDSTGSSAKPDMIDPLKEVVDRYHDINIVLKELETSLNRIEKAQEKAFGQDLIDSYNQQIEVLNKQINATNIKMGIARVEAAELRGILGGSGVSFNADGTVSNYAAALKQQENYVNGIIGRYNAMGASAQESYKKTVENAQEGFEKFKENLERYDELISDDIPGLQDKIQDAIDKITETNINAFKMEIDLRLDLSSAERDWNDFKKKVINRIGDDDILGGAQTRLADLQSYLKGDNTGEAQKLAEHLNQTLDELEKQDAGLNNIYGKDNAAGMKDLIDYFDKLKGALRDVIDLQEELHEDLLNQMDKTQKGFDDQINQFKIISKLIEHDKKLIELQLGEDAFGELEAYYDKQDENYKNQLAFQQLQVQFWEEQMAAAEAGSDEWENAKEKWQSATGDWTSLIEETLENVRDKFENTINNIFKNLNDTMSNGKGLEFINEQWDLINENADQYLDEINKMQGIDNLTRKFTDAINQNLDPSSQQRLNKLKEKELELLKTLDKVSEKDLERAEKRLEIELARIALEEAQANKSQLRLRRDSQGNYRYQYVADDDQVSQAEGKLGEAYNSLYNFDKERYTSNLDAANAAWEDYQEKMTEAALINDPLKRAEREKLIQEQYGELINGIVQQNQLIRTELEASALENLEYLNMDYTSNFIEELVPQWLSGVQEMVDKMSGPDKSFETATLETYEKVAAAGERLDDELKEIQATTEELTGKVLEGQDKIIDKNIDLLASNEGLINSYRDELTAVKDLVAEVDRLANAYDRELEAAKRAQEYQDQKNKTAADAAAQAKADQIAAAAKDTAASSGSSPSGSAPVVSTSSAYAGYRLGGQAYTVQRGDSLWSIASAKYGSGSLWQEIWDKNRGSLRSGNPNLIYPGEMLRLKSGGYTGNWSGDSGRLALLDQKELVLNSDDTKNILQSVGILRNITDNVNRTTLAQMAGINSGFRKDAIVGGAGDIQQDVIINANFPNARNHNEIEMALTNLSNAAVQHIHSK